MGIFSGVEHRKDKVIIALLSAIFLAVLGVLDAISGASYSFLIFYLIPLFLVAWYVGRAMGLATALACAIIWAIDDLVKFRSGQELMLSYWNTIASCVFFILVGSGISSVKQMLDNEKQLARIDHLTGIANSRYFEEVCRGELNRASRTNRPVSLIYLDLDEFKAVNTSYGRHAGDLLLKTVALALRQSIRTMDFCARLSSDNFIVLLPDTGYEGAEVVISRIEQSVTQAIKDKGWFLTLSIGSVTCARTSSSVEELLKAAEMVMQAGRRGGRDAVKHEMWEPQVSDTPKRA